MRVIEETRALSMTELYWILHDRGAAYLCNKCTVFSVTFYVCVFLYDLGLNYTWCNLILVQSLGSLQSNSRGIKADWDGEMNLRRIGLILSTNSLEIIL